MGAATSRFWWDGWIHTVSLFLQHPSLLFCIFVYLVYHRYLIIGTSLNVDIVLFPNITAFLLFHNITACFLLVYDFPKQLYIPD